METNNQEFKKYRGRIVKEGILKSFLIGAICGSAALLPVAFLTWFFAYKPGVFIAFGVFAFVTAAVAVPVYFLRYRPSVKAIAERIDSLGLEERMLTMTELEGDDSFIAKVQREDTVHALGSVNHMLIKIAVSAALVVPFVVCTVLAAGMTTVDALYYADVIPSGLVTLTPDYTPGVYTVSYSVEEGGEGTVVYYTGDWSEETPVSEEGDKVLEGQDAPAVYAVAAKDWIFVSWSDGVGDPYRHDTVVDGDIFVQAIFEQVEPDPDDPQAEQDSSNEENGGSGEGESDPEQGDADQEGEPQEGDGEGDEKGEERPGQPSGDPQEGVGGEFNRRDDTSQQIIDGDTYYGDEFEDGLNSWHDREGSDSNLPDDLKGFIEDYYGSIETGGSDQGGSGSGEEGGGTGGSGTGDEGTGDGN